MDLELQTLERRWRQTGAAEDEARWLAARVRAGDLPRERLLFAADLGHPAALLALDRPADPGEALEFLRLADPAQRALGRLGREGLVRVGLAAIGEHLDLWVLNDQVVSGRVREVLAALAAWCAAPGELQADVVRHVVRPMATSLEHDARVPRASVLATRLAEGATAPQPQAGRAVQLAVRSALDLTYVLPASPTAEFWAELGAVGSSRAEQTTAYGRRVLARVQRDVVPWALGAAA